MTPAMQALPTDVVFDLGKVVFHWSAAEVVERHLPHAVREAGSAEALATHFFGDFLGDWAEFDRGRLGRDAIVDSVAARTGFGRAEVEAVVDAVPRALRTDPATEALIGQLRDAGVRTWFLSNMPTPYAEHLLSTMPVFGRFEGGVFSCDVGLVKPDPAIFRLAADRFGLVPPRTVFVDDVEVNVMAARRLGWQTVHYRDASQAGRELAAIGLPGTPAA